MQIYGEISTYMALPAPGAPPCDPRSEPRARPRSAHDGPSCNRAAVLSTTQREGRDSATFDPRTWRGWRAAPAKGSWGAHTITSTSHDHDHDHEAHEHEDEHEHEHDHDEDHHQHDHDHGHAAPLARLGVEQHVQQSMRCPSSTQPVEHRFFASSAAWTSRTGNDVSGPAMRTHCRRRSR